MKKKSIFVTPKNAAAEVGYSERHFKRLITAGAIEIMTIGRKNFILRSNLEAWVKQNEK